MLPETDASEFRPELLSRRGEYLAWGSAALSLVGWGILILTGKPVLSFIPFMAAFFSFAALSISLGNWMDRRTYILLEANGLIYKNGLRHVCLNWDEIKQIQVFNSSWGKKVRVIGKTQHFDFRTLGELKVSGEVKSRMGFKDGEKILSLILSNSGLIEVEQTGNSYYYARK
jgi:hypothetical protein